MVDLGVTIALLNATISAVMEIATELGLADSAGELRDSLLKKGDAQPKVAFEKAYQAALNKLGSLTEDQWAVLTQQSFLEAMLASLLDPTTELDLQAVAEDWVGVVPVSADVLRSFFRLLNNALMRDPYWGELLERYQTLRARPELAGRVHEREILREVKVELTGDGSVAVDGSIAVGAGAVYAKDSNGNLINTGDGVTLIEKAETVNIYTASPVSAMPLIPVEPLDAVREKYLRFIVDKYRYLSFTGLGLRDTIKIDVELGELYVPTKARRELPHDSETGKEEMSSVAHRLAPIVVLDLLCEKDWLVLLGDPGAGKSTFLKFLAVQVAKGTEQVVGLKEYLPALIPLAAYANTLEKGEKRLDQFIESYFCDTCKDLRVGEMLREALKTGKALILLDGLDEVKDLGLRYTVVDRVLNCYYAHRLHGNKFVLTSRVVGYHEVRPSAEGLVEATLVDFDDEEIDEFVVKWIATIKRQAKDDNSSSHLYAEKERRELLEAIHTSEGVRRLASNPLLLTILALMKHQGKKLPEQRVELYARYIEILISTWNQARSLDKRTVGRKLDTLTTIRLLAPLALWMHQSNPGIGLVKREELLRQLQALYIAQGEIDGESKANLFLADVHEHTGLLLERGPGEYGFLHLTLEEYLAGIGIALQSQNQAEKIYTALAQYVGQPAWCEVGLLAIGYVGLIKQLPSVAGQVLERLVTEQPGPPGQAVVLAGDVVVDVRPDGVEKSSQDRVIQALIRTMQSEVVPNVQRRQAGLALGRLGWCPPDLDQFLEIEPGLFVYGYGENTRGEIHHSYWIAKYPVTYQQYTVFWVENGYNTREFWSQAGWAWHEKEQRSHPLYWNESKFHNPIFPVVGVSPYEAEAYGAWLTRKLDAAGRLPDGYVARLPLEGEWEWAACGADRREYPWGNTFQIYAANTSENPKAGATTAVCTYPQGVSSSGVWDMSGNVWEWAYTARGKVEVSRGGSWAFNLRKARCMTRGRYVHTDLDLSDAGFRLVLARPLEKN